MKKGERGKETTSSQREERYMTYAEKKVISALSKGGRGKGLVDRRNLGET